MDNDDETSYGIWIIPYDFTFWNKHIDGYSIGGCAALSESNLVFIFRNLRVVPPTIKLIRFFRDEKKQFSGEILDDVEIIGHIIGLDTESSLWLTIGGEVFYLGKNKDVSDFELPIQNVYTEYGYRTIKGLARIGSSVYAAGGWRHVFKRTGKNKWVDITTSLDRSDIIDKKDKGWKLSKAGKTGFTAIGGASEEDMYAAGYGGDCWHYDGKNWRRIDLPTNECVYKIVATDSGKVYMACGGGRLLVGSKNKWKVIKYSRNLENFTQMVEFKNSIYVSTQYQMFKLVGTKLEECSPSKQNLDIALFCFQHLSANDDIMLMCGDFSVAIFDGKNWFPLVPGD